MEFTLMPWPNEGQLKPLTRSQIPIRRYRKGSFTLDTAHCVVTTYGAEPHVAAFTPDALPYALHWTASTRGAASGVQDP